MTEKSTALVVVGAANLDLVLQVDQLPSQGETVLGHSLARNSGGKGMNQAVAAAITGAPTHFLGAVGDDDAGQNLLATLAAHGVDCQGVQICPDQPTGRAVVTVDSAGQNQIVVIPGANAAIDGDALRVVIGQIPNLTILVLQAEVPLPINLAAIAAAPSRARVICNLAPYQDVPAALLERADPLIVNEVEAEALLGRTLGDSVDDALACAAELAKTSRSAIISLGAAGAVYADAVQQFHVAPPATTDVVDTTGAGDALVGVLAGALAHGMTIEDALGTAVTAATASTTGRGAVPSYQLIRGQIAPFFEQIN